MTGIAPRRLRWWPAALAVGAALAALLWIWSAYETHRQGRVLATVAVLALLSLALTAWLLVLSGLSWRLRLVCFGLLLLFASLIGSTIRIRGVSGDLVPILGWRWSSSGRSAAQQASTPVERGALSAATDYPRFLGPSADAVIVGAALDPDWDARPPRLLWRRPVGDGWSGFAVQGDLAVTQEQVGGDECVSGLELADGEARWSHCRPARFEDPLGGPGPRATPTLDGDRVFALGATGWLVALERDSGALIWERDVIADNDASVPEYGVSASPLVVDDLVIVVSGGPERAVAAYDRASGRPRWAAGNGPAAYSSPLIAEIAGRLQVVVLLERRLLGLDPVRGGPLWQFEWPVETQFVAQPLVLDAGRVLLSAGYGAGARMLEIVDGGGGLLGARTIWDSQALKSKLSNFVRREGHVYGLDDGRLACIDLATGRRVWKGRRYGHGQLIRVGELLLIQAEDGNVALAAADPAEFREVARIHALDGKTWNHPALAGSVLLVRNDRQAAAFELPLR